MPRDAARLVLGPVLAEFTEKHPQIHLDIIVNDRPVDIVAVGFDAGVRYGTSVPQDMVAVALTKELRWVVAGSPAYLDRQGRPQRPEDLRRHACIRMRVGDDTIFPGELGDVDGMVRIAVGGPVTANEIEASVARRRRALPVPRVADRGRSPAGAARDHPAGLGLNRAALRPVLSEPPAIASGAAATRRDDPGAKLALARQEPTFGRVRCADLHPLAAG